MTPTLPIAACAWARTLPASARTTGAITFLVTVKLLRFTFIVIYPLRVAQAFSPHGLSSERSPDREPELGMLLKEGYRVSEAPYRVKEGRLIGKQRAVCN